MIVIKMYLLMYNISSLNPLDLNVRVYMSTSVLRVPLQVTQKHS